MKTTFTLLDDYLKKYVLHYVAMLILLFAVVIPAHSQYYTKITSGALPDTPKKTYSSAWADYNSDGWDDMLITDNEGKSMLFKNNGDETFNKDTLNVIYTTIGPSIACVWGDYNNDGNVDLYICNTGNSGDVLSKNFLFRNDGAGIFTRITEGAIVNDMDWSLGAAWADYDNDSFLDLYVANFMSANSLYHNNGDGTFTKITTGEVVTDNFATYAVSWSDYDNDGFQDLLAVNYYSTALPPQNDCLYHNNGDGTFTKNTSALIANDNALTQGASWGDFNNDGNIDLFVTVNDWHDIKHNFLYKNDGNGNFSLSNATPTTTGSTSFGSAWLDVNNDGYLDLYVSNNGGTTKRKNFLFLNNGNETFTNQTSDASTTESLRDFCPTNADYDHNGYPDIFTPSYSATLKNGLYKNNGGSNNWLTTRLVGMFSNKSGIGARIKCYANGMMQTREVSSTSGEYCGSTFAQTFGIGTSTSIDSITINWPSGIHQKLINPTINQILTITEANNLTDITSFSLPQQYVPATINYANYTVSCVVAYGTSLAALSPTITVSSGATILPGSLQTVDFSNGPVTYTVTAGDQVTTRQWVVNITLGPNSATDILTYNIPNQVGPTFINTALHSISVVVPSGTNITSVIPVITLSPGATVVPSTGVAVDFSNGAVNYTVTAENAIDQQEWSVIVLDESVLQNDILTFEAPNQIGPSVINAVNHTVSAVVMYGTPISGIAPQISVSPGASINPPAGTGVNFENGPVSYTVTSQIGTSQVWIATITVEILLNNETNILTFVLPNQVGTSVINNVDHTIAAVVPNGTSLTALTPTITLSAGAAVNPASGTAVNFANGSVSYTVTAENGTDTQQWTVTVVEAPNSETDILTFGLANLVAPATIDINNHTVSAEIMYAPGLSALAPVLSVSEGALVTPASGATVDFSNGAVIYTVTAENGTSVQEWNVTVILNTVGLSEIQNFDKVNLYPNPTNGLIHVAGVAQTDFNLEIINTLGQIIHTENHVSSSNNEIQYTFPSGSKGIYIVRLTSKEYSKSIRIAVR